jgi:hypothetical protein
MRTVSSFPVDHPSVEQSRFVRHFHEGPVNLLLLKPLPKGAMQKESSPEIRYEIQKNSFFFLPLSLGACWAAESKVSIKFQSVLRKHVEDIG